MTRTVSRRVRENAAVHDRMAGKYDYRHREIFNEIEQARLRNALAAASAATATGTTEQIRALDFGCGTGNVTRHLLELGLHVTAVDVSPRSLQMLAERYMHLGPLTTRVLSDADLADEQPDQFDFVATYSVLHHVPDYLQCVLQLVRVLRPGGVLYIDHEASPQHWNPSPILVEFRSATEAQVGLLQKLVDPHRVLNPRWWYEKLRRALNPRYMAEGDIHLWEDDHIEWDRISELLGATGVERIHVEDYLGFRAHYDRALYTKYAASCADMRLLVGRKQLVSPAGVPTQRA